jgi:3-isopropylmalate dehydrogenase
LREALGVFANLRPARSERALIDATPYKPEWVAGADVLIVRELLGGLYYGTPRSLTEDTAHNTMRYSREEIARVARVAFEQARSRRGLLTSVDKANVLETSQLWRRVVNEVSADYPDVRLEHMYVDTCAMRLAMEPTRFDVIVTENSFGDILSDQAAALAGSIGMLPSASIGGRVGLFEPVHGSAPDIAGKNLANPFGAIGSVAMLLRHAAHLPHEADLVEAAVRDVLDSGMRACVSRGVMQLTGEACVDSSRQSSVASRQSPVTRRARWHTKITMGIMESFFLDPSCPSRPWWSIVVIRR